MRVNRAVSCRRISLLCTALLAVACGGNDEPPASQLVDYRRDILPIFSEHCFACHGPDEGRRLAGLRLDTRDDAIAERPDGRRAIAPGEPAASLVIERVRETDPARRMPPGGALSEAQIALLERWIAEGAQYERHWSFAPPSRPEVPGGAVDDAFDAFVLDRLAREGIEPSPAADPATLIRRVTLDLTGLPPTPAEVDAFVADPSDDAYAALVDRLLASPRHAEHLARDWLDFAGYGDTNGIYFDEERTMWPWRDWVIDAFARNEPFDDFLVAQIAGDLLPGASDDDVLATAFLRHAPTTEEGGIDEEEWRIQYAMDRASLVGGQLLGITVRCARCHDHKYDPIPARDFYRLTACFDRVRDRGRTAYQDDGVPLLAAQSPLQRAALDEVRAEMTRLRGELDAEGALARWESTVDRTAPSWIAPTYAALRTERGTILTEDAARSIVASGPVPNVETWWLDITAPAEIRAIRMELGGRRASDAPSISDVSARIERADRRTRVTFESASRLDGTAIPEIVDGRTTTKIYVESPTTIVLVPAETITLGEGETLSLRIDQRQGWSGVFRDIRVLVASEPRATLTDELDAILATPRASRTAAQQSLLRDHVARVHAEPATRAIAQRLSALEARERELAATPSTRVMRDDDPERVTHVRLRGQFDALGDRVTCGLPEVLTIDDPDARVRDRLELARWIVGPTSPTTARVIASHYVQLFFGRGLVGTPDDFGTRGEPPSHPELLDWLAIELRDGGWDMRALVRAIVTSDTYRQSSRIRADLLARDPQNRLFWRGPRGRLDAEVIRDQALFASGLLVESIGGPSVRPYHPDGLYEERQDSFGELVTYRPDRRPEQNHRRSLYTFWRRGSLLPSMAIVDAPSRVTPVARRDVTSTPTQALALMNEPVMVEAARHLAERMRREAGDDPDAQIRLAFRLLTARTPRDEEVAVLRAAYDAELDAALSDPSILGVLAIGESGRDSAGDPAAHAARTLVARTILNLSETLSRE